MNRKKFREGLRDGLPIALGYLAVSFGIGISCHTAGISAFQGFLMSLLNNASAGEYGGITVITENSGVFMMVLMTLIINARYLLMSCALSQRLHPDTPLLSREKRQWQALRISARCLSGDSLHIDGTAPRLQSPLLNRY